MNIVVMYVRKHKLLTLLCLSVFFVAVYAVSSEHGQSSFFGHKELDACTGEDCPANVDTDTPLDAASVDAKKHNMDMKQAEHSVGGEINAIITFTNAEHNPSLQSKFTLTVSSLFEYSSVPVKLYILGDPASQRVTKEIIEKHVPDSDKYTLASLDVDEIAKKLESVVRPMQERFSYKPGAYYNHVLFFLSTAMHRVMPDSVRRIIMLDADLKFAGDIANLYKHFEAFSADNILGIANDGQPVYRHAFWQYRQEHPGTRVGEPPPHGLTGFNSGVLLLDLDRMRRSTLYNSFLDAAAISRLGDEFHFKGHLGDQDFFTLVGMQHEELFYVLPCQWNRQLCRWWGEHGYEEIFDQYNRCDGDTMIYHGNCNTPIP